MYYKLLSYCEAGERIPRTEILIKLHNMFPDEFEKIFYSDSKSECHELIEQVNDKKVIRGLNAIIERYLESIKEKVAQTAK